MVSKLFKMEEAHDGITWFGTALWPVLFQLIANPLELSAPLKERIGAHQEL